MCNIAKSVIVLIVLVSSAVVTRTSLSEPLFPCSDDQKPCPDGTCVSFNDECVNASECVDTHNGTNTLCRRPRSPVPQSGQGSCILPPQPANGIYVVSGNQNNLAPGQALDSFELTFYCRRGYGIKGSVEGMDGIASQTVYCIAGRLSLQTMPQCVRFCKLDADKSISYTCHVPGSNGFKPCKKYIPPGQSVRPICNTPLYHAEDSLLYMKCTSGFWDEIAKCKAECGRITPEGEVLLLDGRPAKRGELPWHAGIYRKTTKPYTQICGGSLITNNVVISAAHCFWDDIVMQQPASNFAVAIGKLYRDWDHENDAGAQTSDVKEIKIPVLFQGAQANYQEDIALLILTDPFIYKPYVRPVCLNFDKSFERWQLRDGQLGKVAGWGLTSANGDAAPVLKVVEYPYVEVYKCISSLPPSFREYITSDKFCAGYDKGAALCHGDSGGGLAFAGQELGVDRYYLRGIVSAAPSTDGKKCNDATYSAFTKISKHEDFIKQTIAVNTKRACQPFVFQCNDGTCVDLGSDCNGEKDCPDGSDEADELCNLALLASAPQCVVPEAPSHGTVLVNPSAKAGDALDSFLLTVGCNEGYSMASEDGSYYKTTTLQINCAKGRWDLDMPKCVRIGLVSWTPTELDSTIEEIFGPRDSQFEGLCIKPDGTTGQCVPYFKCNEITADTTEENALDPCSSGLDMCCGFEKILPGSQYVKTIA